jgi:hypothetical protein
LHGGPVTQGRQRGVCQIREAGLVGGPRICFRVSLGRAATVETADCRLDERPRRRRARDRSGSCEAPARRQGCLLGLCLWLAPPRPTCSS